MKKIYKLLFVIPFVLLLFACGKKTQKSNSTTKNNTTKTTSKQTSNTTKKTLRTTTANTTTEEDVFDILIYKNIEEAATIKGEGIFNLNSSTTISITPSYGYEYVGLYKGNNLLTEELTYEIKDINESLTLIAMFKPINYTVSVEKNIDEAGTISGIGDIPYNTSATIDATLEEEYLFVALYNGEELLTEELPYTIEKVTGPLNLTAVFKQKTYDVVVNQSLENAAVITGEGSFIKGSNTTLSIETNDGYNYLGLYDGETLLTTETTYEVKDIVEPVSLTALFSANSYNVTTSSDNESLGTVTLIDGSYDCGSIIELTATPIEGYKVEGWYVNDVYYKDGNTINFIVPAFDSEVVAKFTIITYTITVTDNINGLSECYLEGNLYDSSNEYSFDWHSYAYFSIYNVLGYDFDYVLINGKRYDYDSDDLYMDRDYELEIIYKLADMEFFLLFDREKLSVNNGILIDVLPDDFEKDVINNEYSEFDGYTYLSGTYKYKSVINITLNIKTNYYLDGLFDGDERIGTIENNVITLTIDNNYNYIHINLLGKICHITVKSDDEVTGSAFGTGDYHYGDYANILATPNKGYKFIKWVDEDGNDYGVIYGYEHDVAPRDYDVPLYGDATYIAVFVPDEFDCDVTLVAYNKKDVVKAYVLTYLSEYEIPAPTVDGYTFVGWLENEDIDSLFSTDSVLNYTMINEDSIIYVYYTPNSYTVTFNLNGGSCSETTKTLVMGDEFSVEVPTKENFCFMGYQYYHEEETHYYEGTSTQIVYFIAQIFGTNPYNAGGIIDMGVVYLNDVLVTSSNTMVYTNDKVVITDYISGDIVVKKNGSSNGTYRYGHDCTFIAIWGALVTKRYNDEREDESLTYYLDEYVSRYETPERTGYTFKGWYVGEELYDFSQKVEHNLLIEAKWEVIDYYVTLDASHSGYGEITSTHSIAHYGDTVTITFTPGDIYTFEYWYNRNTQEKFYDETITFTMPAANVRFTASVTALYLLVKTNDDAMGSVEENTIIARAGSTVTLKATPKEGYGFTGWKYEDEIFSTDLETTFTMPNLGLAYVYAVFGKQVTEKYERLGDKIWFGYYPQTCLNIGLQSGSNSALIDELEAMAGITLDSTGFPTLDTRAHYEETKDTETKWTNYDYSIYPNEKDWTKAEQKVNYETYQTYWEYTYYKAPHMWYIDIDYDGDGKYDYRGVLIYSYRNDEINKEKSSTNTTSTHQDDNHFSRSTTYMTYWFKYELIEWNIIENNDGTVKLVSNLAIDSQNFSTGSNSYASSYVRDFLINDFYNSAFNDLEKTIMNTMTVGTNNDYVTLLTKDEVESLYETDALRITQSSDYAQSQNAYTIQNYGNSYQNCYWLTRSAETSNNIYYVSTNGSITTGKTYMTYYGIRPVISITL